ncbi:MAG: hypothetical protein ACK40S_01665 [Burkholderiaceae bacterium]
MRYEILDSGTVVDTIIASPEFMAEHYPAGAYRLAAEPPAPPAPEPEWAWFIDIGPFTDRLGAASMAIDVSTDPKLVAIRSDFARRKWIDLKDPRVAGAVQYLAGQAHPVLGTLAQPLLTPAQAAVVLGTKPTPAENLALRKLYFGG